MEIRRLYLRIHLLIVAALLRVTADEIAIDVNGNVNDKLEYIYLSP